MSGQDARDFLHRLTTINVNALEPGDSQTGFFLNPQGKIRAAFRLACESESTFKIEVEGGKNGAWKDSLLTVIDQFTFAEKYTLKEVEGEQNVWIPLSVSIERGKFKVFRQPEAPWTSVWGPKAEIEKFVADLRATTLTETEFEHLRIQALVPRIDHEIIPDANPLEIGMRFAIADQKGCYPGQEVIEKIVSLGSPAKRLALLRGAGVGAAQGVILRTEDGAEVGTLTSAATLGGSPTVALGILRKTAATVGKKLRLENGLEFTIEKIAD